MTRRWNKKGGQCKNRKKERGNLSNASEGGENPPGLKNESLTPNVNDFSKIQKVPFQQRRGLKQPQQGKIAIQRGRLLTPCNSLRNAR